VTSAPQPHPPTPCPGRFAGGVALVTGGGSGIGRAVCWRLAAEGALVAVNDLDGERAGQVAHSLAAAGARALPVAADVGDRQQVEEMFRRVEEALGTVTMLVNNAGITFPIAAQEVDAQTGRRPQPRNAVDLLCLLTPQELGRILRTNLVGTWLCSQRALEGMLAVGGGAIVNVSALAALAGQWYGIHYTAAKAGVVGLTRALARAYCARGIQVNAVAPGYTDTPMLEPVRRWGGLPQFLAHVPMARLGTPDEVAALVAYLASPEAAYLVGQTINISGGLVI
jgi:NAD(P)-dependent dehydrogenase (short-subunit alcohol dehydrogenase family)